MKNKIVLSAIALIGFVASSNAQATAAANINAEIVAPIEIAKVANLEFGRIATNGSAGTVVLNPATDARTPGTGITFPVNTGTVNAASFLVEGESGFTYAITLPSAPVTISSGINNMSVGTFTSFPAATGVLTGGAETLKVGATLSLGANQAAGLYSAEDIFDVTVNYN